MGKRLITGPCRGRRWGHCRTAALARSPPRMSLPKMPEGPGATRPIWTYASALDARLQSVPTRTRYFVLAITSLLMLAVSVPNVPRAYVDYAGLPLLNHIRQHETYGTDTIADMYAARVVLNDP